MDDVVQFEQLGESVGARRRLEGVVIGALVGLADDGVPLVDFSGNPEDSPVAARTIAVVGHEDVGREVALLFEGGEAAKPVLIGLMAQPQPQRPATVSVDRDGERLELTAQREIVLRCGDASITLTRAGKVLIRGTYVSSHSKGVNKIKGGAVHIN
jgi:Domain of unknown function (DUF6484)